MSVPKWVKNLSDNDKKSLREVSLGIVKLEGEDIVDGAPLRKKAILCRAGSWEGMYGPVEVTKEKLEAIASKYNRSRANAINENDYVPILVDHERKADLTKGRLDISQFPLEVIPMVDPETNEDGWALLGELRVDEEDAKKKVVAGIYAQLSISFNEDTFDLYEVSFVAVEAARRSIALSGQGDNNVDLSKAKKKISSLQQFVVDKNKSRAALSQLMNTNVKDIEGVISSQRTALSEAINSLKTTALSSTFKKIVKEGRLSKAEFDKLDLVAFSEMNPTSLKAVVDSYKSRPISADFSQAGVSGQTPIDDSVVVNFSKDEMKKQMELQKSGKPNTVSLSTEEVPPTPAPKKVDPDLAEGEEEESDTPSLSEVESIIEKLKSLEGDFKKADELNKSLKETIEKLQAEDKEEPQGEE